MKAKQMPSPFSWEDRRVLIQDGVWFIPDYLENYEEFQFPGWEALFQNNHPVMIEYCSGNGTWIDSRAKQHPHLNWLAVEIRFDRIRKIWAKKKTHQLNNLFALCGEGERATRLYFPDSSVDGVFINFPDPWPKERHAKHRLIKPDFAAELARILKPGKEVTIVTDHASYAEQIIEVFQNQEGMRSIYEAPYFARELEGYGSSFFEQLWRGKGLLIHYIRFVKLNI